MKQFPKNEKLKRQEPFTKKGQKNSIKSGIRELSYVFCCLFVFFSMIANNIMANKTWKLHKADWDSNNMYWDEFA